MRYSNKFDSSKKSNIFDILKWKLFYPSKSKKEKSNLEVIDNSNLLSTKEDFICWLSHASFLIQLDRKRFLIDPVFGNIPFYKRLNPSPYTIEDLGKIDYILISHTHYDHFDRNSIKKLLTQKPIFILPLGMQEYIYKLDKDADIIMLKWYQSHYIDKNLTIDFVPAKHWGRRGIFDTNKSLWGGFILQDCLESIYFVGDSAYDKHFKEIGYRYSIDYALLPIGAYSPKFLMRHHHLNPQEAYQAFLELKAKTMIPMHYGTFQLTNESINEPKMWIEEINRHHINIMSIGEVKLI
jgi:L-ascorbate metabolism protein UlaG (beta-lactamase superfamily)